MNKEQRDAILFVFDSMEEIFGKTFIQKLFFVMEKEKQISLNLFQYAPYNYGPFSKELSEAINELIEEGLIKETKIEDYYLYQITEKGKAEARSQDTIPLNKQKVINQICQYVKKFKIKDLIRHIYQKYPETTVNSLLKKRDYSRY